MVYCICTKEAAMTTIELCFLVLIFLSGAILVYLAICGGLVRYLMRPKNRDNAFLIDYETREKEFDKAWLDLPAQTFTRPSPFGYDVFGRLYMADTPTDRFILCLHGHNNSSIGQLKYLSLFRDLGYNVFMPDHRRSGNSGGDSITFGCYEKHDVVGWIDFLQERYPDATFALFGESMGAATATMVAAMDKRVRFLIEYCGYADFRHLILPKLGNLRPLYALLRPGLKAMSNILYSVDLDETDALSAMRSLSIPVLILHSRADKTVYFSNALALAKANPKAKTVYFETPAHARGLIVCRKAFTEAVQTFVKDVDQNQSL